VLLLPASGYTHKTKYQKFNVIHILCDSDKQLFIIDLQFAGLNTVQNTEIFGNAAQYV
jgi:hypothetical protein